MLKKLVVLFTFLSLPTFADDGIKRFSAELEGGTVITGQGISKLPPATQITFSYTPNIVNDELEIFLRNNFVIANPLTLFTNLGARYYINDYFVGAYAGPIISFNWSPISKKYTIRADNIIGPDKGFTVGITVGREFVVTHNFSLVGNLNIEYFSLLANSFPFIAKPELGVKFRW